MTEAPVQVIALSPQTLCQASQAALVAYCLERWRASFTLRLAIVGENDNIGPWAKLAAWQWDAEAAGTWHRARSSGFSTDGARQEGYVTFEPKLPDDVAVIALRAHTGEVRVVDQMIALR
jgi:hypothetical protein